jgi:RNA polymerase sigma factor (sigma-70 family)
MAPPAEGLASRLIVGPTLRTQPDGRLVALVRAGYETAFEEIVRRYRRPLSGYAAAIVGGGSEDVTQDAFSKAHLALCRDDAEIELRPWLFRIVRNTALNHLRDRPPAPEVLAEAIAGGRGPAEELEQREELAELIRKLRALPEPQRAAIVMRELEGLGHEEIAAALGLSGGGARQAIYRARCALRDGLGMLVPLPLLKAVLASAAGATGPAEVATGTAGAAGIGIALKATVATVLFAGTVGAGVAAQDAKQAKGPEGIAWAAERTPAAPSSSAGDSVASPIQDRPGGSSGRDGARHRTEGNRGDGGTRGGSLGNGGKGSGGGEDHGAPSVRTSTSGNDGSSGDEPRATGTRSGSGGEDTSSGSSGSGDSPQSPESSESGGDSGSGSGESGDGSSDGGSGESGGGGSSGGDSSASGSGSGDPRDLSNGDGLIQQTAP